MKQKELLNIFVERTKNKDPLNLDLKNGVVLDLVYDEEIKNYRGYWKEEDMWIGILDIEFLTNCILDGYDEIEIIL